MSKNFSLGAWCLCWGSVLGAVLISILLMRLGVDMSIVVVVFILTFAGIICMFCGVGIYIGKKREYQDKIQKQASSRGYGYSTQSQSSHVLPIRRVCLKCGSYVNQDDKFCKNCGARI